MVTAKIEPTLNTLNVNDGTFMIRTSNDFGKSTHYNLSTNTMTEVPWGTLDWFSAIVSPLITLSIFGGVFYYIYTHIGPHLVK